MMLEKVIILYEHTIILNDELNVSFVKKIALVDFTSTKKV